jgi:peroxiredoxin Q/BCP
MQPGDVVDDFELLDQSGTPRRLREFLAAGPVVLFFYPAAMTAICTAESCHFRDLKAEFEAVGAQRLGISADDVDRQKKFADKHQFDYPLLSDPDGTVARMFGVHRKLGALPNRRATFVIAPDGTVTEVVKSEIRANVHADKALEALKVGAGA